MSEQFELKPITSDGIGAAIARAEHYRLLNQPVEAQSICLDVLAIDPNRQRALRVLMLAMTDEFKGGSSSINGAKEYANRLTDEYERLYYNGIIDERRSRALLSKGPSAVFAYDGFRNAMDWFEKAAEVRPDGNDDTILRWNACVRTIQKHNLRPRPPEMELGLE